MNGYPDCRHRETVMIHGDQCTCSIQGATDTLDPQLTTSYSWSFSGLPVKALGGFT
jgi:hypothetical protein